MANIVLARGTKAQLEQQELKDGLLSFTIDDGKIYIDYIDENNQLKRKAFYGGTLTIGEKVYDGTSDVEIDVYDGSVQE